MTRLGADALLMTTAFIWGVTFVVQKDIGALPPLAFVAARFALSALAVAEAAPALARGKAVATATFGRATGR